MSRDIDEAKGIAQLAMAMPDAEASIRVFCNNAPEMPHSVGSPEHQAFVAGKDAMMAITLVALRCDHRSGPLSELSPETMLAIGLLFCAADEALSAKVGVDVHGRALR